MSINWRLFRCMRCSNGHPIAIIKHWGFDQDGTLWLSGFCSRCGYNFAISHKRDEQESDIREMFNAWCEECGGEPADFRLWLTITVLR